MSKIFISHSSHDNAEALAVAQWLQENGWADLFLDIDPAKGLYPGQRWQEELRLAAHRCEAVLILISPVWRESKWCLAEFLYAKQLGKPIFGALIKATSLDGVPPELTSEWQLANLVDGAVRKTLSVYHDPLVPKQDISFSETGLVNLKRGLQKAGLDATYFSWPPKHDPHRAPYRGLKALEADDAAIFFGRDAAIVRGLDKIRLMREQGIEQLFVILGASGAGKSSFLRAGLWPRLRRDNRHFLSLPVIRPARNAITGGQGLGASVQSAFDQLGQNKNRGDVINALAQPGGFSSLLRELQTLAQEQLGSDAVPPTIVLSIDQGEELFNEDGRGEAQRLLIMLGEALTETVETDHTAFAAQKRLLALVAIRSDAYEQLQLASAISTVRHNPFNLKPLGREEFKAVIEGPAHVMTATGHKLVIEAELTAQLLEDAVGLDALPQLAFILEQLYLQYGSDGDLRLDEYHKLGGLKGSIQAAIATAFQDPARVPTIPTNLEDRDRILRKAFVPLLVTIDQETEKPKRRVAQWDELPPESYPLLERLIEARLLSRDKRASVEQGAERVVVEVSHEALIRHWGQLKEWLDDDRAFLLWQQRLNTWIQQYKMNKRSADLLLRGLPLTEALEWLEKNTDYFSPVERWFVRASKSRRTKERFIAAVVASLVLQLIGGTVWLWQKGYSLDQALLKAKSLFVSIHVEPESMLPIPNGTFRQGDVEGFREPSTNPVRQVTIKSFSLAKYEVTFEEYDRFAIAEGRPLPNDQGWGRGSKPVINVSWQEAKDYAAWLSKKTRESYRLPTESEWEYAARSGARQDVWAGISDESKLGEYAVFRGNKTDDVGKKRAGGFGLHDMSGNVFEWVEDCWHDTYTDAPKDGLAWDEANNGECSRRVSRGGAWSYGAVLLRTSNRNWSGSDNRSSDIGFRLAQDIK